MDLDMAPLLNGLRSVSELLPDGDDAPAGADSFTSGLAALDRLDERLLEQIALHGNWQELDKELRWIHGTMAKGDTEDLVDEWPDVKGKIESLCPDSGERWEERVVRMVERLDGAVEEENEARMPKAFDKLYRETSTRFYKIDAGLLDLCDELRDLGAKLGTFLEAQR